jgi:hypothetical protein
MGIEVISDSDWVGTNKAISNLCECNACRLGVSKDCV